MRLLATVVAAVCSAIASAGEVSLGALLDWRHAGRLIDRLLTEDRQLDDAQRTAALDVTAVMTVRIARFYAAHAAITIGGSERGLFDAVNRLAEAVGSLLEAMGGSKRCRYQEARVSAERALAGVPARR